MYCVISDPQNKQGQPFNKAIVISFLQFLILWAQTVEAPEGLRRCAAGGPSWKISVWILAVQQYEFWLKFGWT